MTHRKSPPPSVEDVEELIQRSIDGDLSETEQAQLDAHLADHPQDAAQFQAMQRQTALLARSVPQPDPAHLAALRQRATSRPAPRPAPALRIAASIAIFAAGIGLGTLLPLRQDAAPGDLARFARQAEAAHALYVSEVLHPVEVAARDKDHLQTWLSNRLGAPIIAPQLGETGFTLIGGRLLPAGDQASALFMYENGDGDRLSLMATHGAPAQSRSFRFQQTGGYMVVTWQDGPWRYSLVGAEPREPMDKIARMIHGQLL